MLWWMKAMLESEKKKLFCHFIGEIRTVPFENPLTREYHEWTSLISICCN